MRRRIGLLLLLGTVLSASGQRVLSLDSCRQMALRNNKQLGISKLKQDVAANLRKSARTKYLPHVSAVGTYEFTSKEISLLSEEQKTEFSNLGTAMSTGLGQTLAPMAAQSQVLATVLGKLGPTVETMLNGLGQKIVDAFHTDTRNMFAGSVVLTQPLFMGGSIIAMNKMASINEKMADNQTEARRQATLYRIDQAYWQVVSLYHKKKLAEGYLDLVKKLNSDVHKMIDEGVATKSDGLSVEVKVNEAEMTLTKVDDGLVLSRMLLNQLCGLPLN
jgi:outer membrane protein TolC